MASRGGPADSIAWDVFIAHAGPDLDAAREIHDLLINHGFAVYLDKANLDYGEKWDRALLKAQRESRMTLVLVSGNTKESHYQRDEITAAINLQRSDLAAHRVVAIYLGDQPARSEDIPYGLQNTHSIFAHESGGMPGVAQLIGETLAKIRNEADERIERRDIVVELSHDQSKWDELTNELDRRGLGDRLHVPRSLEPSRAFDGLSVMVLPLPFHSEFSTTEIERLKSWVRGGGGLFLLGYYTAGLHHENNVNHLAGVFDMGFREDLVMPAGSSKEDCRAQVFGGSTYAVHVANPGKILTRCSRASRSWLCSRPVRSKYGRSRQMRWRSMQSAPRRGRRKATSHHRIICASSRATNGPPLNINLPASSSLGLFPGAASSWPVRGRS